MSLGAKPQVGEKSVGMGELTGLGEGRCDDAEGGSAIPLVGNRISGSTGGGEALVFGP